MSDKINAGGADCKYGKGKCCITGSGERGEPDAKRQLVDGGRIMD
jgi:hypothetical protein